MVQPIIGLIAGISLGNLPPLQLIRPEDFISQMSARKLSRSTSARQRVAGHVQSSLLTIMLAIWFCPSKQSLYTPIRPETF